MKVKTEAERVALMKKLGLPVDAATLVDPEAPAKIVSAPERTAHVATGEGVKVVLAPQGVDPRAMPVEDIVFDPHLLDGFPSLAFDQQGNAASQYIFAFYKSYGRNKDRNGALQRKITSFITKTRRERETPGITIKENVKATAEQRDMVAIAASLGITKEQFAAMAQAFLETQES